MIEFANADNFYDSLGEQYSKAFIKQLHDKQVLLEVICESSPLAYFVVNNQDDSILYFNNLFCKMLMIEHLSNRMKNRELKSSDIIPYLSELILDKEGFLETILALQDEDNRITVEEQIIFKDGRIITLISNPIWGDSDNYIGRLFIFKDVTESKKNEIELKNYKEKREKIIEHKTKELFNANAKLANEIAEKQQALDKLEKYKLLSEKTRDIIFFVGMDGKIVEANEAAVKCYGYKYNELCDMKILDLRYNRQPLLSEYQINLAYKYGYTFEAIHKRKDGSLFPVEVSSQGTRIGGQKVILSIIRDISERKRMEKQLEYISRHDYLTKVHNRFYLEEFLSNTANIKKNENVLLIMDLDNFRAINDSYGHYTGDKVLIAVADCIRKMLREKDFIARVGEDEFAIYLSNTDVKGAQIVANKILTALEHETYYIDKNNVKINVTASIGVTAIEDSMDISQLFAYADAALCAAKEEGKNRVFILENCLDRSLVINNNRTLTMMKNALVQDRFAIYLQPIYKAGNDILHYEVLVRMLDDDNNILPPSSFIPLAERYGLMPSIDKWVITNTIRLLNQDMSLSVFINLSGISFCDDALLEWIESKLKNNDINPERIGFEITETTAIKNIEKAKMWICKLKSLGCYFALDDFGEGFSSFSYLSTLPVDFVKIDGTFVRDLDSDPTKLALVKAINMVAHTLGKKTIAEFVENESIWNILKELGVDYGQGYFLGKPEPLNS